MKSAPPQFTLKPMCFFLIMWTLLECIKKREAAKEEKALPAGGNFCGVMWKRWHLGWVWLGHMTRKSRIGYYRQKMQYR